MFWHKRRPAVRTAAYSRRRQAWNRPQRGLLFEPLEHRVVLSLTPLNLGGGTEPFVIVDPNDPLNVAVGANGLGYRFSTNGGLTFGGSTSPGQYGGDPGLAVDSQGRVFASYLLPDSVDPANLLDIGISNTNFTNQNLSTNQVVISNGNQDDDKELIAADFYASSPFRDNLYVAWRRLNPEELRYSRSTNNGISFSASVALTTPVHNFTSGADPEVGPNGDVYILYWDGMNNNGDVGEVRLLKSTDGGATFLNPVMGGGPVSAVAGTVGADSTGLDHDAGQMRNQPRNQNFRWDVRTQIDLEADPLRSGYLYAIWLTDPDGTTNGDGSNVMFSRSTNGGANWSAPAVLNDDGLGRGQYMPSLAVDEAGQLVAIWYDERLSPNPADPNLSIFAKVSQDGGQTWTPDFALPGSTFDPDSGGANTFIGDYIKVAAANGVAYASWTQTDGAGNDRIFFEPFSIQAPIPDPYEPNNTRDNPTVLGSEPKVTLRDLTIHDAEDVDWYQYTAPYSGKLIIDAYFKDQLGNLDMRFRDSSGDLIASATSSDDDEQIIVPVVAGQRYYLEVFGVGGDFNIYDLEIENFAAPVPEMVFMDPSSDTGMMNNDNITADTTPNFIILADLSEFESMGIPVLTPGQANAGNVPGVAVQVNIVNTANGGTTTGFATPTSNSVFSFTSAVLGDGNYVVRARVKVFDGATPTAMGNSLYSDSLFFQIQSTAPLAPSVPDLLDASDSGVSKTDNITNKMEPAFQGTGEANAKIRIFASRNGGTPEQVGFGVVGSDGTDGTSGNGVGKWEITVEPLADGDYAIFATIENAAGVFSVPSFPLAMTVDTEKPNTPVLDLVAASDTGRHNADDITNDNTPTLTSTSRDPIAPGNNPANHTVRYRVYDRLGTNPEVLLFNSFDGAGGFAAANAFSNTALPLTDGIHHLKLEFEDLAGNLSDDFLLDVTIDTVAPAQPSLALDPLDDSNVAGLPGTLIDRITRITNPTFVGDAEADAIVRLWADGPPVSFALIDGSDIYQGQTVAVPEDGNEGLPAPAGFWRLKGRYDLNDSNVGFPLDGWRQIIGTAEDVAGNVSTGGEEGFDPLDIFIDSQGPRVVQPDAQRNGVYITDSPLTVVDESLYDLFDPKPTAGPTPLVRSITVHIEDLPNRDTTHFPGYLALVASIATAPGNFSVVGDRVGRVAVESVSVFYGLDQDGLPASADLVLTFTEPLEDDRYQLTISDALIDPAGNALDGESNAVQPLEAPLFPSGDGVPGGAFSARFTVDTTAEVGTYAFETVFIDANRNFRFDPLGSGDDANKDLEFEFGYTTDVRFAGNFSLDGGASADGWDKLAAYGFVGGAWRWIIGNNQGTIAFSQVNSLALQGFPVAGDFVAAHAGDEVGLFNGQTWYFDINGDFRIDATDLAGAGVVFDDLGNPSAVPGMLAGSNMTGFPIVGDFDGDGLDDLGSWNNNQFYFDLAADGLTGHYQATIDFGFPGVTERPVAADMDGDGIDDIGLWAPDLTHYPPDSYGNWYFLLSDDFGRERREEIGAQSDSYGPLYKRVFGTVNTLDHPFSPDPVGQDLYGQFGDPYAIPVIGNFDPPVSGSVGGENDPPSEPAFRLDPGYDTAPFGDDRTSLHAVRLLGETDPFTFVRLNETRAETTSDGLGRFVFNDVELALGANVLTVTAARGGLTSSFQRSIEFVPGGTVRRSGSVVTAEGTAADDTFNFSAGTLLSITLNGVNYAYPAGEVSEIRFLGAGGRDTATLNGTDGAEQWNLRPNGATLAGNGYTVEVSAAATILAQGNGGADLATLSDGTDDDLLVLRPGTAQLSGAGYFVQVAGVRTVRASASQGHDSAVVYDSSGDDQVVARPEGVQISGEGFFSDARGFDQVQVTARGGYDTALLYDSAGDDQASLRPGAADVSGPGFSYAVQGFAQVQVQGSAGRDSASLTGSDGQDQLLVRAGAVQFSGPGFSQSVRGFDAVRTFAGAGNDVATLYDSTGAGQLVVREDSTQLSTPSGSVLAADFSDVRVFGAPGNGSVVLLGSAAGGDRLESSGGATQFSTGGTTATVRGFDAVRAFALADGAQAQLAGSAGDDHLEANGATVSLSQAEIAFALYNFQQVSVQSGGGHDTKRVRAVDFALELEGNWLDME